jgi:uncharacterized protein (TIGR02145 family)
MKKFILLFTLSTSLYFTGNAQEIKSARIGNVVWMLSNLDVNVPGSSYYNEDKNLGMKYGRLYTYEAATNCCPSGWRLPTIKEWSELVNIMGGEDVATPNLLKSSQKGGFNAKLGGFGTMGRFQFLDVYGAFWSATETDKDNAWYVYFTSKTTLVTSSYSIKTHGLAVRCVKSTD